MTTRIINHVQQKDGDQSLANGLKKHEADLPSFFINGTSVKTSDLVTTLQTRLAKASDAITARASWLTAVQSHRDEVGKTKTLVSGLKQAIMVAFASQTDKLADFGLTPRKVRAVKPETMVAAAEKAKATRAARRTMGKKQKLKITGATAPTAPVNHSATASATASTAAVPAAPAASASPPGPAASTATANVTPR